MTDTVDIEVTRIYTKSTTIRVLRNGRSFDELISDYEYEIQEGLEAASLQSGEDNYELRESPDNSEGV